MSQLEFLQPVKKVGRPKKIFDVEQARSICNWIASGKTLSSYCDRLGKPSMATVYRWLKLNEIFMREYVRARRIGFDVIAEDTLKIIDQEPHKIGEQNKYDMAHVNWMRNRVAHRLQLLARWDPKRYGNNFKVDTNKDVSLKVVTNVPKSD